MPRRSINDLSSTIVYFENSFQDLNKPHWCLTMKVIIIWRPCRLQFFSYWTLESDNPSKSQEWLAFHILCAFTMFNVHLSLTLWLHIRGVFSLESCIHVECSSILLRCDDRFIRPRGQ